MSKDNREVETQKERQREEEVLITRAKRIKRQRYEMTGMKRERLLNHFMREKSQYYTISKRMAKCKMQIFLPNQCL